MPATLLPPPRRLPPLLGLAQFSGSPLALTALSLEILLLAILFGAKMIES